MAGPLQGIRVIEMAGLGPVPLAGLMLSELGAEVVRVERINATRAFLDVKPEHDLDRHGRRILRVDLKSEAGRDLLLRMGGKAEILMEGFRPGVMERLGLGPQDFAARNPALIYGRMTGFGQEGPLSKRAGHDLTYLALSGVLSMIGPRDEKPVPPLNLVGDYGGGTMFLLTGLLAALIERGRTGKGQVVDAAMVDGASMLALSFFGFMKAGIWQEKRGENLLDSGAPFYDTYETADGGYLAVACLEPQFFAEFSRLLPLEEPFASNQYDRKLWPEMRKAIAARLKTKTRDEWDALFEPTDACVAPVLSLCEAPEHPHNRARQAHVKVGDMMRPAPAPRFSTDKASVAGIAEPVKDLSAFGIDANELEELVQSGVIGD